MKLNEIQATYKRTNQDQIQITSPGDSDKILRELFPADLDLREAFIALYVDRSNKSLGYALVSLGGISGTAVDIKVIYQHALLVNASGVILCHNHPSGALKPSESDKRITEKIVKAGKVLDIEVLDHLIITSESYYSFANNGLI